MLKRRPLVYIALDIETTGKHFLGADRCLTIGWACGAATRSWPCVKGDPCIRRGHACVGLGKPVDVSWADFWSREGFEASCFQSFWSQRLGMLDRLQDPADAALVPSERDMISRLDGVLRELETEFEKVVVVTDTTCYDTVWLSYLLAKHGFETLLYRRSGEYNGGAIELESYRYGVYDANPEEGGSPWLRDRVYRENFHAAADHHPQNDAHAILCALFACMCVVADNQLNM